MTAQNSYGMDSVSSGQQLYTQAYRAGGENHSFDRKALPAFCQKGRIGEQEKNVKTITQEFKTVNV